MRDNHCVWDFRAMAGCNPCERRGGILVLVPDDTTATATAMATATAPSHDIANLVRFQANTTARNAITLGTISDILILCNIGYLHISQSHVSRVIDRNDTLYNE
jgi:hypothetical protein